jgi:hypothetical protein
VGWGIVLVGLFGLFFGFVICQEMFAQRHWRGLVKRGDSWAIKSLVDQEIERWRGLRTPKGMNPALWHGIQTAEVAGVGRDFIHVISSAEGEFRVAGGKRQEVSSPLTEGTKLAAALLERLFFDIPNVRLSLVRVDIYTTFRAESGAPEQLCILTTTAERADADRLPWDDLLPAEILNRFETRYQVGPNGDALPIDPGPPLVDEDDADSAAIAEVAAVERDAPVVNDSPDAKVEPPAEPVGRRNGGAGD